MFTGISTFSFILSIGVGALLGYLIGFKFKRPRTKPFFIFILVVFILSPTLLVSTIIIGSINNGQISGVFGPPFILGMTSVILIAYLVREKNKEKQLYKKTGTLMPVF